MALLVNVDNGTKNKLFDFWWCSGYLHGSRNFINHLLLWQNGALLACVYISIINHQIAWQNNTE